MGEETKNLKTKNLELVLKTPEEIRAFIQGRTPAEKAEMSADWLAMVESATSPDPWIHGFGVRRRERDAPIGICGFKGPPSADGVVEIAYGIDIEHQGHGYATEAAQALVAYALSQSGVRAVRAHTLPEENPSTRVLTKCGFRKLGEVLDLTDHEHDESKRLPHNHSAHRISHGSSGSPWRRFSHCHECLPMDDFLPSSETRMG